jgi:hypothetical protein
MNKTRDQREIKDWERVLKAMYETEQSFIKRDSTHMIPMDHRLFDYLDLDHTEVVDAVEYLKDAGLIDYVTKSSSDRNQSEYVLTDAGFKVIHDLELVRWKEGIEEARIERELEEEDRRAKRQHRVNRAIAFLTLGLMLVTVIDTAVRATVGVMNNDIGWVLTSIGLIVVGLFAFVMNRYGLFDAYDEDQRA